MEPLEELNDWLDALFEAEPGLNARQVTERLFEEHPELAERYWASYKVLLMQEVVVAKVWSPRKARRTRTLNERHRWEEMLRQAGIEQ